MTEYTVEITETKTNRLVQNPEWAERADGEKGFAYTPEIETIQSHSRIVYRQTVDELDLVAVIQAINGMERTAKVL